MICMPIQELKLYYLEECTGTDLQQMLYGYRIPVKPTLKGWIKYWRRCSKDKRYVIIYKSDQRKEAEARKIRDSKLGVDDI